MKTSLIILIFLFVSFCTLPVHAQTVTTSWTWTQATTGANTGTATSFQVLQGTASGQEMTVVCTTPFVAGQTNYSCQYKSSTQNPLTVGTTYFLIVEAVGPGGTSGPSNESPLKIPPPPAPAAPSGFSATATNP